MAHPVKSQQHPKGHPVLFKPNFVFELADKVHSKVDNAGSVAAQLTKSSALRAFRGTVMQAGSHLPHPGMNASGNLRGMVVSKRARYVFNISSNVAEKFEKYDQALAMAGIIIEIGKESESIYHLSKSNLATGEKVRQSVLMVSTAILRAVTSVVPAGAHVIAKPLEGYCELGGLVTGGLIPADKWVGALDDTDVKIKTAHQTIFSPAFMELTGDAAFEMIYAHLDVH